MAIQAGTAVPTATLTVVDGSGTSQVSSTDFFSGKKVVVFGVPGAFTPTCSEKHLPGFIEHLGALQAKGVDTVACITVNDPFVVDAWLKDQNAEGVVMIADGSADYVKALGVDFDMSARGFGVRSARFAMIVDNGTVTHIGVEEATKDHDVSSATAILAVIG